LSHITGISPSTNFDLNTRKIPNDIKLANEQFDQPGSIDLLIGVDLFQDMLRSGRRHVLAINQFYKKQFLAGHSQVELQLPLHGIALGLHFCSEKTTVWSII